MRQTDEGSLDLDRSRASPTRSRLHGYATLGVVATIVASAAGGLGIATLGHRQVPTPVTSIVSPGPLSGEWRLVLPPTRGSSSYGTIASHGSTLSFSSGHVSRDGVDAPATFSVAGDHVTVVGVDVPAVTYRVSSSGFASGGDGTTLLKVRR